MCLGEGRAQPEVSGSGGLASWERPFGWTKQTSNRAERWALLDCAQKVSGDLTFLSDSAYVVRGWFKLLAG
eukprot:3960137-Pyramimonas_sp.AAC.1